jgi:hypothetical protein
MIDRSMLSCVAANVLQLAEGGDFGAPTCQATTNVYLIAKKFLPPVQPRFWQGAVRHSSFLFE